jgi:predicted enzyme related to lactoylglutathione lyase
VSNAVVTDADPPGRSHYIDMTIHLLINVDVNDIERATRFYTGAFGLSVGRRFGETIVELLGASSTLYLLSKEAASFPFVGANAPRQFARHWTPVHLDIVVTDVDEAVRQAEAAGAIREGDITSHSWGRLALLADPFGNGFCLIQFLGRGYDEIAAAEMPSTCNPVSNRQG